MNFSEAIAEVVRLTKRPDRDAEIQSNLNKAITFFTLKGKLKRDLVELSIPIDANLLGQTVDLTTYAPRLREFKYIRPRSQRYYLKPIDPDQIFTAKGSIQPNRYFLAGTTSLTITLSVFDSFLEVGYYKYPAILTPITGFDAHWMLDMIPWAITEWAASQTFQSIGDDQSAKYYQASAMALYLTMRRDLTDE